MVLAALHAAPGHAQSSGSAAKAILTVNDTDAIGKNGDSLLSLDEAVRLANGTLVLDRLSAAERAQIKGAPGARSRDLITLPKGATLTVPEGAAVTPITGNDGDILDGNGAMLASGAAGKGTGLILSSSNFTLRNFQGRGFATIVNVEFGGRALSNISLEKLRLLGASPLSALLVIGATASNGSLHGLSVADSVFDTEGQDQGSLVFIAAAKTPQGATVDNVGLDDLRVVRNQFHGGRLGLYVTGSLGAGRTSNAVTRNVVIADNIFTGQHDAAANFVGALPAVGGRHTKVGLENVVATGNRLEAANWGFYIGNEMFGANNQPGEMTDSYLRNITVSKNIIVRRSNGAVGQCIALENAADYRGDQIANNLIENVRITGNDISGCVALAGSFRQPDGAGITVHGGKGPISGPESGGGVARNNVIRNIEISNNRVEGSTRGIAVIGGVAFEPGTATGPTVITGNSVMGVRIEANRLENNPTGIWVAGGEGAAGARVSGNSVTGVKIQGNQITGSKISCKTIADAASATGNSISASCQAITAR